MARHPTTLSRANTDGPSVKSSRLNGTHTNGDAPPPSTLAAQIVQNQTTTKASQQSGEKATFAGLLHEILHNPSATPETDIGVNVQLISVVVEAGLSILTRDDPFAQLDILLPQAADSLAVVEATIVRQSDVLFAHISQDGPPLIIWLLARLLPLCSRPKCGELKIAGLINSAISAASKSKFWRSAAMIQELTRECVNGMYYFQSSHAHHAYVLCRYSQYSGDTEYPCWKSVCGATSCSMHCEAVARIAKRDSFASRLPSTNLWFR
jgi:hypothetical protein